MREASHIFSTKNIGKFKILSFEIIMKRLLTTSLVLNNRALIINHMVYRKFYSSNQVTVTFRSIYLSIYQNFNQPVHNTVNPLYNGTH